MERPLKYRWASLTDDQLEYPESAGIPLPPLEEQKRIAEILWAADEAVSA